MYINEDIEKNLDKKVNNLFEGFVDKIKRFYKKTISKIHYDLYSEIKNSDFKKSKLGTSIAARAWFREYIKNTDTHWRGKPMQQGKLYIYRYKYPKFMDTLEYWDTEPLVLSLGVFKTKNGDTRELGINLHLLPPRVRILVLYEITNRLFKQGYKNNLYKENQKPIPVTYKDIVKPLMRFGIGFAIRMYIPSLRTETIYFPVEEYSKAIYLTSRKYEGITQEALQKRWSKYTKEHKLKNVEKENF